MVRGTYPHAPFAMKDIFDIKRGTPVTVTILGPDGTHISQTTLNDVGSAAQAVRSAINDSVLILPEEDCVFIIKNMDTLEEHEYRFNAHDRLTPII